MMKYHTVVSSLTYCCCIHKLIYYFEPSENVLTHQLAKLGESDGLECVLTMFAQGEAALERELHFN